MAGREKKFWKYLESFDASPGEIDQEIVSEYFAMWRVRVEFARIAHVFEEPLVGISPSFLKRTVNTRNDSGEVVEATNEDSLEHRGVGFYSTDRKASARSMTMALITQRMDYARHIIRASKIRWGAIQSPESELILPDRTTSFDLPISPRWFLHGFGPSEDFIPVGAIPASTAKTMNQAWFDDAYHVVVANSPDVLRALIPTG